MVKVDLDALKIKIASWEDEYLINEAINNIKEYTDDVQKIILAEYDKRNIDAASVAPIKEKHNSDKVQHNNKNYGIKGVLLFFVIISFFNILRSIGVSLRSSAVPEPDYLSIGIDLVLTTLLFISTIHILQKKKNALIWLNVFFISSIVVAILNIIASYLVSSYGSVTYSISRIIWSLFWMGYFSTSERVKTTLVN